MVPFLTSTKNKVGGSAVAGVVVTADPGDLFSVKEKVHIYPMPADALRKLRD